MEILKTILTIVFIIISLVITVVILMQEGKQAGLGSIAGAADTYWGKNKGRSMEGMLVKVTKICVIAFLLLLSLLDNYFFYCNCLILYMFTNRTCCICLIAVCKRIKDCIVFTNKFWIVFCLL